MKLTHLDVLKHIVDTDPWQIAHRLFSCMECPKLAKCNMLLNSHPSPDGQKEVCKICINEWLNEEVYNEND